MDKYLDIADSDQGTYNPPKKPRTRMQKYYRKRMQKHYQREVVQAARTRALRLDRAQKMAESTFECS